MDVANTRQVKGLIMPPLGLGLNAPGYTCSRPFPVAAMNHTSPGSRRIVPVSEYVVRYLHVHLRGWIPCSAGQREPPMPGRGGHYHWGTGLSEKVDKQPLTDAQGPVVGGQGRTKRTELLVPLISGTDIQ